MEDNAICLSEIDIEVMYQFTTPSLLNVVPNCGPISGGTIVSITAASSFPSSYVICSFGEGSSTSC